MTNKDDRLKKLRLGPYDDLGSIDIHDCNTEDEAWDEIVGKYLENNNTLHDLREDVKRYNSIYSPKRTTLTNYEYKVFCVRVKNLEGKIVNRLLLRQKFLFGSRIEIYSRAI